MGLRHVCVHCRICLGFVTFFFPGSTGSVFLVFQDAASPGAAEQQQQQPAPVQDPFWFLEKLPGGSSRVHEDVVKRVPPQSHLMKFLKKKKNGDVVIPKSTMKNRKKAKNIKLDLCLLDLSRTRDKEHTTLPSGDTNSSSTSPKPDTSMQQEDDDDSGSLPSKPSVWWEKREPASPRSPVAEKRKKFRRSESSSADGVVSVVLSS